MNLKLDIDFTLTEDSKLIVFGDDHVRQDEPYFSAKTDFFNWVLRQDWNNDNNIMLHLGDMFHKNLPTPKEYDLVMDFLSRAQFQQKILIPGNGLHEFNRGKGSYAIEALSSVPNTTMVYQPKIIQIDTALKILLLPWIPNSFYEEIPTMKDYYEVDLPEAVWNIQFDYVFGHFDMGMFSDGIDVSNILGSKRMGHIHIPDEQYVGSNTKTRADEKGTELFLNRIDIATGEEDKIPIPNFLDYEDIHYPEYPDPTRYERIYDIYDAPSKEVVLDHYEDYYIKTVYMKQDNTENVSDVVQGSAMSMEDHMKNFIIEKNINKDLGDKLLSLIRGVA